MIDGIDVSRYNGLINWDAVVSSGVKFAICKATEGTAYRDPRFDDNFAELAKRKIVRGAYHYYRPTMNAIDQARNFYAAAQNTQLPPILDVELHDGYIDDVRYYRNTPKETIIASLQTILNEIERLFGKKPIIYTGAWFWNPYIGNWGGDYLLWTASYTSIPRVPDAWSTWSFWQYTSSGSVPGILGNVDLDYFNGTIEQLLALCGEVVNPPTQPAPLAYARVRNDGLRVRSAPWGSIIGVVNAGDILDVYDVEGDDAWLKIGEHRYACLESNDTRFADLIPLIPPVTHPDGFDSPVGTPEERAGNKVYPGDWFSALDYCVPNQGGYHTGNDLNNNVPWDHDARAPVYAIGKGRVVYAATVPAPSTWGGMIVIQHAPLSDGSPVYSRYGHVENILVSAGDEVVKGQRVASIGQYQGGDHNYHLHFDIADDVLETDPLNWPGDNKPFVEAHYRDPAPFIREHRLSNEVAKHGP